MVAPPKSVSFGLFFICTCAVAQAGAVSLSFSVSVMSAELKGFPKHPGQSCTFAEGQKWVDAVVRQLSSDWSALYSGAVPRTLLQYTPLAVPVALVLNPANAAAGGGTTQSSVHQRDMEISKVTDSNVLRALSRTAHEAEMKNDF